MDRYQEEIRRAAAKGVRDLNLDPGQGGGQHSSLPRQQTGSVAATRALYLQKISQNNSNSMRATIGVQRRQSADSSHNNPYGSAGVMTISSSNPWSGRGVTKSNSASNVLNGSATTSRFLQQSKSSRGSSASPILTASESSSLSDFKERVRALGTSSAPASVLAQGSQQTARVLLQKDAIVANGHVVNISRRTSPLLRNGGSPEQHLQQVAVVQQQQQQQQQPSFRPGTYPQAEPSGVAAIPIYENLEGLQPQLPELPQRGHVSAPPPPPPPYLSRHQVVSPANLVASDSRSLSKAAPSLAHQNSVPKSILKSTSVVTTSSRIHQPPYMAPPTYENIEDQPTAIQTLSKRSFFKKF